MLFAFAEAPSISGASWSLVCMIISLILLFIAAFVTGGGALFGPNPAWPARGIAFGWAGLFFFVLALALR